MILFQGRVRVPASTELDLFHRQPPEEKAKVEAPKDSSQSSLEPDQQQQREKNTFGLEDDQLGEETTRRDILTGQEEENPTDHELEKDVENEANLLPGHTHREQENIQWKTQKETSEANKAQQKYLQLLPLPSAEAVSIQQVHRGRELLPPESQLHKPS